MAIETFDDVLEYIADRAGVYGAHDEEIEGDDGCRICFVSDLEIRIRQSLEVERKLKGN